MQIYSSPHFNLNSMHTIRVQNANYTNAPIRRNKQELCTKGLGPGCFPPKITVLGGGFCHGPSFNGHQSCSTELCLQTTFKSTMTLASAAGAMTCLRQVAGDRRRVDKPRPRGKRCYRLSTPGQGSPQGISTHSDWPEGTRCSCSSPQRAALASISPAPATSPTKPGLQARTVSSGQQGGSLAAETIGKRVTTIVQPHQLSDEGGDASQS